MINTTIQKLHKDLVRKENKKNDILSGGNPIKINKMIGKVAVLYEKVRNSLEYSDEHLLRKNAIHRILKRRLVEGTSGFEVSRLLINELIRAKYLDDNTLPETYILTVGEIINKYIELNNYICEQYDRKIIGVLLDWTMGMLAAEVEYALSVGNFDDSYIEAFYKTVDKRVVVKNKQLINQEDLDLQLYIAVTKAVTLSDRDMLSLKLLRITYPEWKEPTKNDIREIASKITKIKSTVDTTINHRVQPYLTKKLKPYAINFRILRQLFEEYGEDIHDVLSSEEKFEVAIRRQCAENYQQSALKIRRNMIRSIVYIFFTKVLLAVLVELPADYYVFKHVNYLALGINIVFPPMLLFAITIPARAPSKNNTDVIVEGMKEIVYTNSKEPIFELKSSYSRNKVLNGIFTFLQFSSFVLVYGGIIVLLKKLHFNIVSGGFFLVFLSIISYFGIRVRRIAQEYQVISQKETFFSFILDIFSFPILSVGKWVALKTSQINVFTFILDFIIEAPFKTFLEVIEDWFGFIKEKKEEI